MSRAASSSSRANRSEVFFCSRSAIDRGELASASGRLQRALRRSRILLSASANSAPMIDCAPPSPANSTATPRHPDRTRAACRTPAAAPSPAAAPRHAGCTATPRAPAQTLPRVLASSFTRVASSSLIFSGEESSVGTATSSMKKSSSQSRLSEAAATSCPGSLQTAVAVGPSVPLNKSSLITEQELWSHE